MEVGWDWSGVGGSAAKGRAGARGRERGRGARGRGKEGGGGRQAGGVVLGKEKEAVELEFGMDSAREPSTRP